MAATDRVKTLLYTLDEARDAWHAGSGGEGTIRMPTMYNEGSYQELERALAVLRDSAQGRRLWWHASARWRWGTVDWVQVPMRWVAGVPVYTLPPRSELLGLRELSALTALVRLYSWPNQVDEKLAEQGILLLSLIMYDGEYWRIQLPSALRQPVQTVSYAA